MNTTARTYRGFDLFTREGWDGVWMAVAIRNDATFTAEGSTEAEALAAVKAKVDQRPDEHRRADLWGR